MSKVGEAYVEIHAKTDKFQKELTQGVDDAIKNVTNATDKAAKEVSNSVNSFGTQFKNGISKAVVPATLALASIGTMAVKAVGAASDLGESINAVNVVYGKAADGILALSKNAATAVGLSQTEFNAFAVQFSSFAEKIAGPGGDIVGTIESISVRAADFASVMNLQVADAAQIFQSGLAGETEPLKKFGIDLSEAAVKAYALANNIGSGSGELTEQEKILARYGSLMAQTQKTQGDFANTSDSLANRTRIATSQFKDLLGQVGERLIPVFETFLSIGQDVIDWAKNNETAVYVLVGAVAALATTVLAVNAALKVQAAIGAIVAGVQGAYALITGKAAAATAAQAAATTTATTAQMGLNTAMALNPVGLIVAGILALVAAIVIAYKKFEGFRKVVDAVINFVIAGVERFVNSWITAINFVIRSINTMTGVLDVFGINVPKIAEIAEVSFGRVGDAANKAAVNTSGMTKAQIENMELNKLLPPVLQTTTDETKKFSGATSKAADAAAKAAAKVKDLRKQISEGFETALQKANDALTKAKESFKEFSESVASAVTSILSFGNAQSTSVDNTNTLADAIAKQTEAQTKLDEAMAKGDPTEIARAQRELADAIEAVGKAQAKPMTFFDALEEQANKVKDFGVLVNRLIAANISDAALQQVLDAGVEAGSAIATELLSSADGVLRANDLVAQVESIGESVGLNASGKFKQAGVDAATALVQGIESIIANYQINLKSKKLTAKQLKKLKEQFAVDVSFAFSSSNVPELANGAIVGSRTPAIIGEAGPEAVIPISRPARALQLMEQSGLAELARRGSGAALNIENATFVAPIDADLIAQKVLVAEKARSL